MKNFVKRKVKVAAIQPPIPKGENGGVVSHEEMVERGIYYLEMAGKERVDIICLPEVFNVFGLSVEEAINKASKADNLKEKICRIALKFNMYVIYTCYEKRDKNFYISSYLIDRKGEIKGRYDKTHPTRTERERLKVIPGNKYPVFKTDFGKIGIMICYDCYFPEVARILTLKGADIIFWPTLQRHFTDEYFEIQIKARAMDYSVFIVRSSYGASEGEIWKPDMMIGRSCIVDRDGRIVLDLGHYEGFGFKEINLKIPRYMEGPGGCGKVDIRKFILEDRRPETYKEIIQLKNRS